MNGIKDMTRSIFLYAELSDDKLDQRGGERKNGCLKEEYEQPYELRER